LLKYIQKWLHNNFVKKYGFGWLYRDFFLHVAILDRGFWPKSNQTKDNQISICCGSTNYKHAVIKSKSKNWLTRNQINVSEWSDMYPVYVLWFYCSQNFAFERIWWRLFQKRAVRAKFNIYVLLQHVVHECDVYSML
jgi:hypothetical protein